jgi:hypothetical protein
MHRTDRHHSHLVGQLHPGRSLPSLLANHLAQVSNHFQYCLEAGTYRLLFTADLLIRKRGCTRRKKWGMLDLYEGFHVSFAIVSACIV